ncbi:hypothetical protein MMC30_000837 [Trapelia coarctata]|nr:hypothetical protein [Trapelia coarctata]
MSELPGHPPVYQLKRYVAQLSWEIDMFVANHCKDLSENSGNDKVLRERLQNGSSMANGRIAVDALMRLAPKRRITFIRHFLATELFAAIEPSSNSENSILNPHVVALLGQLEDGKLAKENLIRIQHIAQNISPSYHNEESLLQLHDRITSVLQHFGLEPEPLLTFKPMIEAAQTLGRSVLKKGEPIEVDWSVPSDSAEGSIMVFPKVAYSWSDEGVGVFDYGVMDTPFREGIVLWQKR